MPRKITNVNELTDNAAAMADHRCELCGAPLAGHNDYGPDVDPHASGSMPPAQGDCFALHADPLEVIQRIALFMADDWKACAILLLYIAAPNAPISWISEKIRLSPAAICDARKRAAARFPKMAVVMGLKNVSAAGQQARFAAVAAEKEHYCPSLF